MHPTQFLQKRRLLLALPLFFLPFLFGGFYTLEGGRGASVPVVQGQADSGFNAALPTPIIHPKDEQANKQAVYERAALDSARWRLLRQRDTNLVRHSDSFTKRLYGPSSWHGSGPYSGGSKSFGPPEDPRAARLLAELDHLQQSLQKPVPRASISKPVGLVSPAPRAGPADPEPTDPQLETLNGMLDKILRIQHPDEAGVKQAGRVDVVGGAVLADTVAVNSLSAVVAFDQVLVAGSTIALRLEGEARIGSAVIPKGQMVYGVVSISNDRMMVRIHAIRKGVAIYPTVLQVYDMDALPGIHIPGDLGRETAKQSADQSLNGVSLLGVDPGLGAQAANAGLQTAKALLSRKVRTVRVGIRAGYQVLLRNEQAGGNLRVLGVGTVRDSLAVVSDCAGCDPFMYKRERGHGLELVLQGIYLQQGTLYFLLRLQNVGPIDFHPAFIRWSVRDRHRVRRIAVQDRELEPVRQDLPAVVPGDGCQMIQSMFVPFALAKDKRLVVQVAEGDGARVVELAIDAGELSHLKVL